MADQDLVILENGQSQRIDVSDGKGEEELQQVAGEQQEMPFDIAVHGRDTYEEEEEYDQEDQENV